MHAVEHCWKVPAEAIQIPELRHRVGRLAAGDGLSDEQVVGVQLATCEAATNCVRHGYPGRPRGTITITVGTAHHRVRVQVVDDGVGLGAESGDPGAGLGTLLIESLASEVHRSVPPGGGASVEMLFTA